MPQTMTASRCERRSMTGLLSLVGIANGARPGFIRPLCPSFLARARKVHPHDPLPRIARAADIETFYFTDRRSSEALSFR
jgi:hypothetical protein